MEALNKVLEANASSITKDNIQYILEKYIEYLDIIKEISPKYRKYFLEQIKKDEIINNQEMEHENGFLCKLNFNIHLDEGKMNSIDVLSKHILENETINTDNFTKLHRVLISGSSDDEEKNYELRNKEVRVSCYQNGNEVIQYIPPQPEQIKVYLDNLFKYMCDNPKNGDIDVFYKAFIIHFYVAALQPFGNGNTRLARLLEYGEIFKSTRDILNYNIESPALFMSKNYLLTGRSYRDKIAELVQEPSQKNIDRWIEYNTYAVDEQLNFSTENAEQILKKQLKR